MTVSLQGFLRTGNLGDLRCGMSKEEVRAILGPPDAMGGTSRKYPEPSLFLYGTVELWFRQQRPHDLTGFWWEAGEKGEFRLSPVCIILDWEFTPDWTFAMVEDYLNDLGLAREYRDPPVCNGDSTPWITLETGITISFHGGRLYGIHG
jgi:hypothetical protein